MPYSFRVHIHLGAHKTASTFIQNWLSKHMEFLAQNQIAYIPLARLRQKFMPAFWRAVENSTQISDKQGQLLECLYTETRDLGFDLANTKLLLLSEENLLGGLNTLVTQGLLYPRLEQRMNVLAQLFNDFPLHTFLAIRNYADFYPSAYAETIRHQYLKSYDEFLTHLAWQNNSWLQVIATIQASLAPLTLWAYEDFREHTAAILSALLDLEIPSAMIDATTTDRPSLSQKGLDLAMHSRHLLTPLEMKRLVNLLADKMIFEPPDNKIVLPDPARIALLNTQYQTELMTLAPLRLKFDQHPCNQL
ncbi:hypothetical protein VZ94_17165 [Methylocucumis oryzae]|uniref:Sulfotransferase domain-containing protein n=2 Tax=Methylocucumis oryzae TaxID=1632867 RepID=A0A0F3IFS1_9GAMM|nr:hypothetical protein VZ94_17165 [Methylocucumis oryzae]